MWETNIIETENGTLGDEKEISIAIEEKKRNIIPGNL